MHLIRKLFRIQFVASNLLATREYSIRVARPLRPLKPKSTRADTVQDFVDSKPVYAIAGDGGNGKVSFLSLWCNEFAGPDGGDGGNGAHVLFVSDRSTTDLSHVENTLTAHSGITGNYKIQHGKNATHLRVSVPIGTIVKNDMGQIIGDLSHEGTVFIAARGGAGGKGNHYFRSDTMTTPDMAEKGGRGERLRYFLEIKSMAHVGLLGLPNAGKSTLLRAITRARPKVAPYPFTTLRPHIGMVQYDDFEQVAIADLPGIIPESHKNRGLGIQFLRHVERCAAILYILDMSQPEPWLQFDTLQYELQQFSEVLLTRPQLVIANKMDLLESQENLDLLRTESDVPIIPISAKMGTNLTTLLKEIRLICDNFRNKENTAEDSVVQQ